MDKRTPQPLDRKPWINGHSLLDQWSCIGLLQDWGVRAYPLNLVVAIANRSAVEANAFIAKMILAAQEPEPPK